MTKEEKQKKAVQDIKKILEDNDLKVVVGQVVDIVPK